MKSLLSQVETLIIEAGTQSEELIKDAVRQRMGTRPYPGGFSIGMGTYCWSYVNGNSTQDFPKCEELNRAVEMHIEVFGTFSWRIDRAEGTLKEISYS